MTDAQINPIMTLIGVTIGVPSIISLVLYWLCHSGCEEE